MPTPIQVTFVVTVNKGTYSKTTFWRLRVFACLILAKSSSKKGYTSASRAYNDGIDLSTNDTSHFVHQDIILPENWFSDLERALSCLKWTTRDGVRLLWRTVERFWTWVCLFLCSTSLASRLTVPREFRRSARDRSHPEIIRPAVRRQPASLSPVQHRYLHERKNGRKNHAISAFCIHNTQPGLILPAEFECYRHVKRNWKHRLPICRRHVFELRELIQRCTGKGSGEMYIRYIRWKEFGGSQASGRKAAQGCRLAAAKINSGRSSLTPWYPRRRDIEEHLLEKFDRNCKEKPTMTSARKTSLPFFVGLVQRIMHRSKHFGRRRPESQGLSGRSVVGSGKLAEQVIRFGRNMVFGSSSRARSFSLHVPYSARLWTSGVEALIRRSAGK